MTETTTPLPRNLAALLLPWYKENARLLPWRENITPYRVWISEIMLQQTRIEAAKGYFARFMAALPDVERLAAAPEEQVLKLWEGLGYYSRARNLHKAAKKIVAEHNGVLPADWKALRALPGIGDYTAGAIASIAFGLPEPAVDGNVLRICTRLTACPESIADAKVKNRFRDALSKQYPETGCGEFTSALMELGETICTPGTPDCAACPLQNVCRGRTEGNPEQYPVMPEKKPRRVENRTVFLLIHEGHAALQKRPDKGLLAGMWEFPHVEGHLNKAEAMAMAEKWGCEPLAAQPCGESVHIFSHLEWRMTGWRIECAGEPQAFTWADDAARRETYAVPTAFKHYKEQL